MDSSNYSGHSFVFFVGNRKSHGLPPQRRLGDKESLSPRVERSALSYARIKRCIFVWLNSMQISSNNICYFCRLH